MRDRTQTSRDGSPSTLFVDAALSEHSRLGFASQDSELVRSILLDTVNKDSQGDGFKRFAREEKRLWLIGAASAAAVLAALATVFAVLPFKQDSRDIEEIQFVVQYAPSVESPMAPSFSAPAPKREPEPFSGSIELKLDQSSPVPFLGEVSEPELLDLSFPPSFASIPEPTVRIDKVSIEADEVSEVEGTRFYEGNVEIRHDNFVLQCDRAELFQVEDKEDSVQVQLVAFHASLEQLSPVRRAVAGKINYLPSTDQFLLRDIIFVESSEGVLNSFQPEDLVRLSSETLVVQKSAQVR